MTNTSNDTKIVYFAMRDTANQQATDENRAMAHAQIYNVVVDGSETQALNAIKTELVAYVIAEVAYLRSRPTVSGRADEIMHAIPAMLALEVDESKAYSTASVTVAGLVFTLIRSER